MDATMFSTWLGEVVSLTRAQRRKTFMLLGLRGAEDDRDLVAGETDDELVPAEAPEVIGSRRSVRMQSPAVPSGLLAKSDCKFDALTTAACAATIRMVDALPRLKCSRALMCCLI